MRTAAALAAVLVLAASCGGPRTAAPSATPSPAPPSATAATPTATTAAANPSAAPGRPIEEVIAQVDEARLVAHLNALVAFGSRDPRNPGHEKAAQYLRDQLRSISGVSTGLHQTVYNGIRLENIIVTISPAVPASSPTVNGAIVLCAHYDSTAAHTPGWRPEVDPAPGADDDATGTAAVLEMVRILAGERASLRRPVILAFFDGEELSYKGSEAYEKTLQSLEQPIRFGDVIDVDTIGFNPTADRLDLVWYADASAGLRDRVVAANDLYKIGASLIAQRAAAGAILDATPFGLAGIPAVGLVERYGDPDATYPGNPALRTVNDTADRVTNHRLWLKAAKLALATALELARSG